MARARAPPDADTRPWTRELCDDVDSMPDYENVKGSVLVIDNYCPSDRI